MMNTGWGYFVHLCQTIRIAIKVISGILGAIVAYVAFILISQQIQAMNPPTATASDTAPLNGAPLNAVNPQFAPKPGEASGSLDDNPRRTPPPKNMPGLAQPGTQAGYGGAAPYGAGTSAPNSGYGAGVYGGSGAVSPGAPAGGQTGTPNAPAYGSGISTPGGTGYGAGASAGGGAPYGSGTTARQPAAGQTNRQFSGPGK